MRLNKNEIAALIIITRSKEPVHPRNLRKELGIQKGSVSRLLTNLQNKGLIERAGGEIILAKMSPAEAFKKLYYSHRASPLQDILSGRRIELLSRMGSSQKSLETLAEETGISSDTVYYYLQDFLSMGIISRSKEGKAYFYSFNYIIWPELKEFVTTLLEYQILHLVPREALLIKSYEGSVLFKSLRPQEATLTSFSVYEEYGIELRLRDYYYTLPKRKLSVGEIFTHSLDSTNSIYQRLYCILFYLKNKDALKGFQHPMIGEIMAVLRGERLKGYPTREEIEEQAELYGIHDIEP